MNKTDIYKAHNGKQPEFHDSGLICYDDQHAYKCCRFCGEWFNWADGYGKHMICERKLARLNRTTEKKNRDRWQSIKKKYAPIVFKRDAYNCNHCGATENLTIDHIIPIIKGGTNDLSNLQTLCSSCNSKKGGR